MFLSHLHVLGIRDYLGLFFAETCKYTHLHIYMYIQTYIYMSYADELTMLNYLCM